MIYQFSTNFDSTELCVSKDRPDLAKKIVPTSENYLSAKLLAILILQPIRDKYGIINILSWLRSPELNNAIGGCATSDHLLGCAADISPKNADVEQVFLWIIKESNLPFRECIYYPNDKFIHISWNHPSKPVEHEVWISSNKGKYLTYDQYYGKKT